MRQRLAKMEEKYEAVKITLREDMRMIADLDRKVKMLNQTAMDASIALETLEGEHEHLKADYLTLMDNHKHCVVCLSQQTKRCEGLEEEKRKLEEELYHLQVRAAAGFEELTPRPSFAQIYESLGTEAPPPPTRTSQHISTLSKLILATLRRVPRTRLTRKMPTPGPDSQDSSPKS